jgi:hypothetical protein
VRPSQGDKRYLISVWNISDRWPNRNAQELMIGL